MFDTNRWSHLEYAMNGARRSRQASTGFNARHSEFSSGGSSQMYRSTQARARSTVGRDLKRAALFATAGSGMKRESLMNSIGLLTKHQKAEAKASGAGFMARHQGKLVGIGGGVAMALNLEEGGGVTGFVGNFMMPEIGFNVGMGVGRSLGTAAARSAGMSLATGSLVGGALGAVSGAVIGVAAGAIMADSTNSDNLMNQLAESMSHAEFGGDPDINNGTLTHRQRAMNKLSKSALNDRGMLLGAEAQVLASVI